MDPGTLPGGTEWINGHAGAGAGDPPDPADRVTLDESINMAFLVVLESMTPAERVAFILHDVFRYSFAEVAGIVGRTPAACRQLAATARRHLRESRDSATPAAHRDDLVRDFKDACESKDIQTLIAILDTDATSVADGGGQASLVYDTVEGAEQVARTFAEVMNAIPGLTIAECTVNGQPGLVTQQNGVTVTVLAFDFAGDRITHIWAVRNPEKLQPWTRG